MSTEPEPTTTLDESTDPAAERIKHDIEQTRDNLSETVAALEERLNPSTLRTALREEVQEVEQKVRSVLGEQLSEAKAWFRPSCVRPRMPAHRDGRGGANDPDRSLRRKRKPPRTS
jgi:hypothetical protein